MKLGLATSTALHAGVLAWALVTLNAPPALETADVEVLPVDIVSIEEFTTIVAGTKDAPKLDAPAPDPVEADPVVEEAENVGRSEVDVPVDPAPVTKPIPVEETEVATDPDPVPNAFEITEVPAPATKPATPTAPTTEIADTAEAAQPVVPNPVAEPVEVAKADPVEAAEPEPTPAADPIREAIEALEPVTPTESAVEETPKPEAEPDKPAEPQFAALPSTGPKALYRPPKARPARTPSRENDAATRTARKTEQGERNVADELAALINREKASGGGAKRPTEKASQGGDRTTGAKLSASEMDALRRRIGQCWNPPSAAMNAGELTAKVRMRLDRGGNVVGRPEILSTSGGDLGRIAAEAGARAMRRCAPYDQLPAEKFETWSEVVVNFDPREMF